VHLSVWRGFDEFGGADHGAEVLRTQGA